MKALWTVVATSLVLLGPPTGEVGAVELSNADVFFSGNDVYSWCQGDKLHAQAYTAGLFDFSIRSRFILETMQGASPQTDVVVRFWKKMLFGYCEPRGVTVEQVTDLFCLYLRDTPGERKVHASMLFSKAMKKNWPCEKS